MTNINLFYGDDLLTRRVQTCINLEPIHLEWLKGQKEGMSEHINKYVKACIEEEDRKGKPETIENPLKTKIEIMRAEATEAQEKLDRDIREFFEEHQHMVYLAKVKKKRTARDISYMQQELRYFKDGVVTSTAHIQAHLKEAIDKLDVKKYELENSERLRK